jgi:ABC-2 type transport system ATP-binding protein
MKLHIATDSEVRGVIAAANGSVEIRSFCEIIPSMNDIFIRAVNGNL